MCSPQINAHYLLGSGNGCRVMRRFTWTVSTKGLERRQKDEDEPSPCLIEWFNWHGWLDYWLRVLTRFGDIASAVVTRNILDGQGKRKNSSREGINHAQTATLRYARVCWPGWMD